MNPIRPEFATADSVAPELASGTPAATSNDRLCHLFRLTLQNGRIHPLYLPLLKYRHAKARE